MSPKVSLERGRGQQGGPEPCCGWTAGRQSLFGFPGHRGPFWLVLSPGGAAERAGVPPGARLLEVNGVSVEKLTHNQLNRKVWLVPLVLTPLGLSQSREADSQSPSLILYLCPHPSLSTLCSPHPSPPEGFIPGPGKKGWEGVPASALPPQLVDADALLGPTALAEWQAGDPAGGRARGGGTVSPAGNAPGCSSGRGLGTAHQAPLFASRERAPGLRVRAPGGEGP